ncbi:MAG TPA: hypothetical protein VGB85_28705 [Nannocystis sp.]
MNNRDLADLQEQWLERLTFWAAGMTLHADSLFLHKDLRTGTDVEKYRRDAAQHLKRFARHGLRP